jgi:aryl-alcohol dehydrogenase-like predicted oxidoreductase
VKYRRLGRTGIEVSEMAHGLWGMSGWSGSDDRESLNALQLATDLGANFFDTAWAYGNGKSDGLLGEILSSNPQKHLYAAFQNSTTQSKVAGTALLQVSGCFSCGPCS